MDFNEVKEIAENIESKISNSPLGRKAAETIDQPSKYFNYDASVAKLDTLKINPEWSNRNECTEKMEGEKNVEINDKDNYKDAPDDKNKESDVDESAKDEKGEQNVDNDENASHDDSGENQNWRDLTDEEKAYYAEKLGWTQDKLDNVQIDENGTLHINTINQKLEGKTAENGVPYVRKQIEINGVKIEGVFPVFDSLFDTYLSPEQLRSPEYAKICNEKLKEEIEHNPELKSQFSPEQLEQIKNGKTPDGYVWHHNEETGKMQLVKQEDHEGARHTGGSSLWGYNVGGSSGNEKGVSF